MGQVRLPENIAALTKTSTTVSLPASVVNVSGQQYITSSPLSALISVSGAGGLDTGAIAANTAYYVYVVLSSGAPALIISLLATGPVGFTYSRLVGKIFTNSSSQIDRAVALNAYDIPTSEVHLQYGNGNGSSRTSVRRWLNTVRNVGSAIAYTDSASNGAEFQIKENGIYAIHWSVRMNAGVDLAITKNQTTDFSVAVNSITDKTVMIKNGTAAGGGVTNNVSITTNLSVGDIIRFIAAGTDDSTNFHNSVTITKVGSS